MKAVFITNTPAPYQLRFAEELNRHMHMQFCFSMESTGRARPSYWKQELPANCRMLPAGRVNQLRAVHAMLDEQQPDVLWLGGNWQLPGWLAGYRWAKKHGVPVVVGPMERANPAEPLHKKVGRDVAMKSIYPRIDAFLAAGHETFDKYKYLYRDARVYMFPYAADVSLYLEHPVRNPKGPGVTFVAGGRMDRQFRFPELLKVFARIVAKYPHARLSLTGWSEEREECERIIAADEGLKTHVDWKQVTSWEGIGDFYQSGDVAILYASWGGWGLFVQETMASGMGIITGAELSAGRFMIQNGVNGYLVHNDDELFRAMESYILAPEQVFTHGTINKRVAADSTFEAKSKRLKEIFSELVTRA